MAAIVEHLASSSLTRSFLKVGSQSRPEAYARDQREKG
jgi:hypothetical protein